MPSGVYVRTAEHNRINSEAHTGMKLSAEHKKHIGEANKGKKRSEETKRRMSEVMTGNQHALGHVHTEEAKRKIGENNAMKRPEVSAKFMGENNPAKRPEVRRKIGEGWTEGRRRERSEATTGDRNPMKRPETKRKMSEIMKTAMLGEKNPMWKGGISFEPYGIEFNNALKLRIRQRDNFTCQMCGAIENSRQHHVHHIDYNKKNNRKENLITLCWSCHMKTNFNREYWEALFKKLMLKKMSKVEEGFAFLSKNPLKTSQICNF